MEVVVAVLTGNKDQGGILPIGFGPELIPELWERRGVCVRANSSEIGTSVSVGFLWL